jgi:putative transposase
MPRTARSIHAGLYYHVLNRGNNRATVFSSPDDFDGFLRLMKRAQARRSVDLLAACLMPNHFHLVVRPVMATDLSAWIHWLLTTHAKRHHRQRASSGRIWTSRFKAFPIQDDRHLLTVVRYVERNALRAALVESAEEWRWGSLRWRFQERPMFSLTPLPIRLPANWADFVNAPQTAAEIAEVRRCVNRGSPFGDSAWVQQTATDLGLGHTLGRRGRPRKSGRATVAHASSTAPPK